MHYLAISLGGGLIINQATNKICGISTLIQGEAKAREGGTCHVKVVGGLGAKHWGHIVPCVKWGYIFNIYTNDCVYSNDLVRKIGVFILQMTKKLRKTAKSGDCNLQWPKIYVYILHILKRGCLYGGFYISPSKGNHPHSGQKHTYINTYKVRRPLNL